MSAWAGSPYRAIGVYIGGLNRGCSQPNLTASWVAEQTAADWSLIPTYVGLQAPTSSCSSCAKLSTSTSTATSQGTEAANDAVAQAADRRDRRRQPDLLRHGELLAHFERQQRDAELPCRLDGAPARARLPVRRLQQRRLGDRRPRRQVRHHLPRAGRDLVRQLERARLGRVRPLRAGDGLGRPPDPPVRRRPRRDLWRGHDQHRQQLRRRGDGGRGDVLRRQPEGQLRPRQLSRSGPGADLRLGLRPECADDAGLDPRLPRRQGRRRRRLRLRARARSRPRNAPTCSRLFPRAGAAHGFDSSFPVVGSGRQRLCVYALNIGPGADKLLGCRAVGVPVPISRAADEVSRQQGADQRALRMAGGHRLPGTDAGSRPGPAALRRPPRAQARAEDEDGAAPARPPRLPARRRRVAHLHPRPRRAVAP